MKKTCAALEVGEQRRQVARALEHRARRAADADAQLARDDVGERRLAEARRPAEQHVVEHVAARARGLDLHAQVLAHRLLADVLVERPRPQRRLDERGPRRAARPRPGSAAGRAIASPPSPCSAARMTSSSGSPSRATRSHRALGLGPAVAEIDQRRHRLVERAAAPRVAAARRGARRRRAAPRRSRHSTTMRSAKLLADARDGLQPRHVAGRDARRERRRPACPESTLSAVRGPRPFTLRSRWKSARSRGVERSRTARCASSRTSVWTRSRTVAPAAGRSAKRLQRHDARGSRRRRRRRRARSGVFSPSVPASARDHRAPPRAPRRAPARADAARSGACCRWQSASASASAASAGGRARERRARSVTPRADRVLVGARRARPRRASPPPGAYSATADAGRRDRREHRAAHLAEAERALHVARDEGPLEHDDRRASRRRCSAQTLGVQPRQPRRPSVAAPPSTTVPLARCAQQRPARSRPRPSPVTRASRVDPERPHLHLHRHSAAAPRAGRAHADSRSSSSAAMSMFDDTLCTSS